MDVYDASEDDKRPLIKMGAIAAAAFFGLGAGFTYAPLLTTAFVIGTMAGWWYRDRD